MRIAAALAAALLASAAPAAEVIASRTIAPGAVLAAADLRVAASDPEALRLRDEMIGLEARRAIYAGRPVTLQELGPPTLVRRNDVVTLRFIGGRLEIRTEGRALEAGGQGERIRVLNLNSRQPVAGRVIAPAQVEVRR